jgi:hypothetical protein
MSNNSAVLIAAVIGGGMGIIGVVAGIFVERGLKKRETRRSSATDSYRLLLTLASDHYWPITIPDGKGRDVPLWPPIATPEERAGLCNQIIDAVWKVEGFPKATELLVLMERIKRQSKVKELTASRKNLVNLTSNIEKSLNKDYISAVRQIVKEDEQERATREQEWRQEEASKQSLNQESEGLPDSPNS